MQRRYTQLSDVQRERLAGFLDAGYSLTRCAEYLRVHKSTVSREVRRNRDPDGHYSPVRAQQRATVRRQMAKRATRKFGRDPRLRRYVLARLRNGWSPERIAHALRTHYGWPVVSHETIYKLLRP